MINILLLKCNFTKQRLNNKLSPSQPNNQHSITTKYDKNIRQMMGNSTDTFTHLETPGWSSLVKSQISQRKKAASGNYQEILSRINKMKGTSFNQNQNYKNVSTKPLNLKKKSHKHSNTYTLESQYIDDKDNNFTYANQKQRVNKHPKLIRGRSYTANHLRKLQRDSETKQNTETYATKHKDSNSYQKDTKSNKRWNQISVHEHLYLNGKHLDNKKMIAKIIDEEYQKKQILKFKPEINPKSIHLAQSKFSRIKQKLDYELTPQKKDQLKQIAQGECRNSRLSRMRNAKEDKQNKQVERYKQLNKCFYFLSNGNYQLNQKLLHDKIEQLPFSCIKTLHPILQKVYSGTALQWTQFLDIFNSKQINNKQGFFVVFGRWLKKQEIQSQQTEEPLKKNLTQRKR